MLIVRGIFGEFLKKTKRPFQRGSSVLSGAQRKYNTHPLFISFSAKNYKRWKEREEEMKRETVNWCPISVVCQQRSVRLQFKYWLCHANGGAKFQLKITLHNKNNPETTTKKRSKRKGWQLLINDREFPFFTHFHKCWWKRYGSLSIGSSCWWKTAGNC